MSAGGRRSATLGSSWGVAAAGPASSACVDLPAAGARPAGVGAAEAHEGLQGAPTAAADGYDPSHVDALLRRCHALAPGGGAVGGGGGEGGRGDGRLLPPEVLQREASVESLMAGIQGSAGGGANRADAGSGDLDACVLKVQVYAWMHPASRLGRIWSEGAGSDLDACVLKAQGQAWMHVF